jgi:hypothetical protein
VVVRGLGIELVRAMTGGSVDGGRGDGHLPCGAVADQGRVTGVIFWLRPLLPSRFGLCRYRPLRLSFR